MYWQPSRGLRGEPHELTLRNSVDRIRSQARGAVDNQWFLSLPIVVLVAEAEPMTVGLTVETSSGERTGGKETTSSGPEEW